MYQLLRFCSIIAFSMILVGCSLINTNQKTIDMKKKSTKNTAKTKTCNKYIKNMNYASAYIKKEFEEGYFSKKDIVGAKAQLYLIENNSPSPFAKNINAANNSYAKNYNLAKKSKCSLQKYRVFPISKLKVRIKTLELKAKK